MIYDVHGFEGVDQKGWSHQMAIYAAMIDRMDQGLGRILEEVKLLDDASNTLIIFLSDNGATNEFYGNWDPNLRSEVYQGEPWANVSNTPFKEYKRWTHEGGIRTPLIAYWPHKIKPGGISDEPGHVIDIMATFIDIANAQYPASWQGENVYPYEGISLYPIFNGKHIGSQRSLFWYFQGSAAIRKGRWKLVAYGNGRPWLKENPPVWELYDIYIQILQKSMILLKNILT